MPHSRDVRRWPGKPHPLGATWDGSGTNFALFSANATSVELCLFDESGTRELAQIPLGEYTHEIWHTYIPDIRPGQLYGYRVNGPWAPAEGHRFNRHKLLIDPYARALHGQIHWHDALFGYQVGSREADLSFDTRDSAPFMPKCKVVDDAFTWGRSSQPERPWDETIIYEMHARGFTMQHPAVVPAERGTFAGLAHPEIIAYLQHLGITAVELLPVHAYVRDRHLIEQGLTNFWGYNSLAFFAPDPQMLKRNLLQDFKSYVQVMHDAGIEVLLDVVYNHTGEGNHMGPHLSFRGIDNRSYYLLQDDNRRYYRDMTGTGNTLDLGNAHVMRMVTDSLRYWSTVMKVDGFRFDLATTLMRVHGQVNHNAPFMEVLAQDPVLSRTKLIAEPWDVGPDGYQLGGFPPGWSEWNDRYRDTVRRFWKGDGGLLGELASRISGSSDLYDARGRRPWASINFVTAHDGFTLRDLVSYNEKHNAANGEGNRDGHGHNHSWNGGEEGPTTNTQIRALRLRRMRSLMATLLLSQGVPMITAGDELGRTQNGNNNAYCQDNATSWMPWHDLDQEAGAMLSFTREMIALRRRHVVLRRSRFFHGQEIPGTSVRDVVWLHPDGREMGDSDWHAAGSRSMQVLISGQAGSRFLSETGQQEPDDTFLLLLHAGSARRRFQLPMQHAGVDWTTELSSARITRRRDGVYLPGFTCAVLRLQS